MMVIIYGAMTHERKTRIWELWRKGIPMSLIACDIAKPSATVYSYLLYHAGIKPRQRIRREIFLSFEERETISRNGGRTKYRAQLAEKAFMRRSKRPKPLCWSRTES
jgi:hypothetical protein